ncbi:unnamed protein product [Diatraea saccharalis]|uniref:HYDIN/VesB/CFA65-like Ig-like domain-containing protein n=1 Tax=Diatraea saccharalis TaxID=40085 RepID=A0A9N9WBL2_9NEOP|nr:unnamed protein product [Diatraea saccharalis]
MFSKTNVSECERYNPDNVFKRFKTIEFPTSFVGLSTTKVLDVEVDLNVSAYLKTMFDNKLMKFTDAWEVSASHRAFNIRSIDNHTIAITFNPKNGKRCCNNELHSEVGRYYICGEFEYCTLSHSPDVVNFGNIFVNQKVTRHFRIRNESRATTSKMKYVRITGFEVTPQKFTIPPNSSRHLTIALKPTCLLLKKKITFEVRNCHDITDEMEEEDENFLTYIITIEAKVSYNKNPKEVLVESLHKLKENLTKYTYLNEELKTHNKRKDIAQTYLAISKKSHFKKTITEKFSTGKDKCVYSSTTEIRKSGSQFCKNIPVKITTYQLFDILFTPFDLEFGRIGLSTYGEKDLTIKNNSKYDITIKLLKDDCVLYTENKLINLSLKLKSKAEIKVAIFCLGIFEGNYAGTFEYVIDNKYYRKHPYHLQVGNPTLMVLDKCLKFGMVTSEYFVTSVPVKIINNFNVDTVFRWDELHLDAPFEIIPMNGIIPKQSCRICDILYVSKPTKSKTHEVDLMTGSKLAKTIPLELNVVTRKLSIKFLQTAVTFKDIALNIETMERVKLENSSREIAFFYIVEPLIPGFRIQPMSGTIRPKMVITFEIIVKISCILEFAFDVYVKINNKENVILPVNGLLGPPDSNSLSTDIRNYIGEYERSYDNNPKVKLKTVSKDIAYCRITGVITVPWIKFSEEHFEIDLKTSASSNINFSMKNVSKYSIYVTILTSKLGPNFSLDLQTEENHSIINESNIKFELDQQKEALFTLKFHPKGHGKFVTTALLYLDKHMTIPYHNLTFIGKRQTPTLTPSTYRIVFPPCYVNDEISRTITLIFEDNSDDESFSCMSKEEPNLVVEFLNFENIEKETKIQTIVTVQIKVCCKTTYARKLVLSFNHTCGSGCDIEVSFCFTYCQLTLHTLSIVKPQDNPYPYFPLNSQTKLYDYLDASSKFLEKWMFQQGFRRDLYPIIPDTFHAISAAISSSSAATKSKGINVSYLNFVKRIAGPLMKHIRKIV